MANVYNKFRPGEPVTCHAAGALTGGRLVRVTATPNGGNPVVNVPAAGGRVFGVAAQDAASGSKVTVLRPGGITQIEAGATVNPGDLVEANASGQVILRTTGIIVGEVVGPQTTVGNLADVDFRAGAQI